MRYNIAIATQEAHYVQTIGAAMELVMNETSWNQ